MIGAARERGVALGLVTTTYRPNVEAIAEAAGDQLELADFGVVVTTEDVRRGKPAPDAYEYALAELRAAQSAAVAIEDTAVSAQAAIAAGVPTIVVPGEYTDDQMVTGAEAVLASLADEHGELHADLVAALGFDDDR